MKSNTPKIMHYINIRLFLLFIIHSIKDDGYDHIHTLRKNSIIYSLMFPG